MERRILLFKKGHWVSRLELFLYYLRKGGHRSNERKLKELQYFFSTGCQHGFQKLESPHTGNAPIQLCSVGVISALLMNMTWIMMN